MHKEVTARHYRTGRALRVRTENGVITAVAEVARAPRNLWIAPTLFDVQMNGFGGVDFQSEALSLEALLHATRALDEAACPNYLLTLITSPWDALLENLRNAVRLREERPELRRAIRGFHIEGPFLCPEPGFHGAHNPQWMRDPRPEDMAALRKITGPLPLLVTLAPERNGAPETIRAAQALGIQISFGHTNAPRDVLLRDDGPFGITHLGNGCPGQLDRHDNILWRILDTNRVRIETKRPAYFVGLIPDKVHVSPQFFRILHRLLPAHRVYYTTDAVSAAGAPPGRYRVGESDVEAGPDGVVRRPGQKNFAGSSLRPIDGVARAAEMLGVDTRAVWRHFSEIPRTLMGVKWALKVGEAADFQVIRGSE